MTIPQPTSRDIHLEHLENCPLCGSGALRHKFAVKHIADDALHSWALEQGFPTAPIVECRDCGFVFKAVRPSQGYLEQHYAQLDASYVERVAEDLASHREDYRVARETLLRAFPCGGSILDVGCASGYLLASLGEKWSRHGIELFRFAAQQARERGGISVHECDIASAGFADDSFDVVCSFDVVEHMADPVSFFREARRILKPSGWLLVGTGDWGSFGARFSGSRWAYLPIPEHISFFSARSLETALRREGFSRIGFRRIHHGERTASSLTGWLRGCCKNWAIAFFGGGVVRVAVFREKTSEFVVPYFFDHMLCVAR